MKKSKKILTMLMCALLAVAVLSGCGNSFDHSAYLKALMDNSYKNDPSGMVAQKVCSEEEANALFDEEIQAEIDALELMFGITFDEELRAGYEETFKKLYASTKYTVGEAEKVNNTTYKVTVNYEQLQVYSSASQAWLEAVAEMTETIQEDLSDDEKFKLMAGSLKDELDKALANPTYAEEASTTVTISVVDNAWAPDENDITKLNSLLFDVDAASGF